MRGYKCTQCLQLSHPTVPTLPTTGSPSSQRPKKNGDTYRGTGFKIQLPGVNYTAVVTAGHNLVNATKTSVTFPGQKPITSSDFYIAPEYTSSENDDYDYGLVLLPGNSDDGFGWSTQLTDSDLNNRAVSVCGYPGDKEYKTMWISGGNIMSHTARRIYYSDDTTGGESGVQCTPGTKDTGRSLGYIMVTPLVESAEMMARASYLK